jgi:hypothetical protein
MSASSPATNARVGEISNPRALRAVAEMYVFERQTLIGKDTHFKFESLNLSPVCRRKRIFSFDGRPPNNMRVGGGTVNSLSLTEGADMVIKSMRRFFKGWQSFQPIKLRLEYFWNFITVYHLRNAKQPFPVSYTSH